MAAVDSTNRVALEHARSGHPGGLVVVADFQRAGRGRHGRTWEATAGSSLLVSVLLRPELLPDRRHLALALQSLAGCDACERVAGVQPGLKWPNDLVVADAKLGGVLAEVEGDAVVVGLGLNVAAGAPWPPGAVALEAASGRPVDIDELLEAFLAALSRRYGDWTAVASDYRRACTTIGRTVRVEMADEHFSGTGADVTDDGHLLVDVGMCLRTVTAGDVVHLHPFPTAPT